MDWSLLFFACLAFTQLALSWIRLGFIKSPLVGRQWFWVILGLGLMAAPVAANGYVSIWAQLFSLSPFLIYLACSSLRDASYLRFYWRKRLLISVAPIVIISIAASLARPEFRLFLASAGYPHTVLAGLAIGIASTVLWADYRNIQGLDSEGQDVSDYETTRVERKLLGDDLVGDSAVNPPLDDLQVWARVIFSALTVVLIFLQVGGLMPIREEGTTSWASLFLLALSYAAAIAAYCRVLPGERLGWLHYCLLFTSSSLLLSAVILAAGSMALYSDFSVWPMAYRITIGILIAILYTEDAVVSYFVLNRFRARAVDLAYAAFFGVVHGSVFVATASISFYEEGSLRLSWISFMGLLLLGGLGSSIIATYAFAIQVPPPFMTRKSPKEIMLADQAMFIGLLGGCVAGVSLLSNGQSPQVATAIGALLISFIAFCRTNFAEHQQKETYRISTDGRWSNVDKALHLRVLKWHLRLQELLPIFIVLLSFLWATLSYWTFL